MIRFNMFINNQQKKKESVFLAERGREGRGWGEVILTLKLVRKNFMNKIVIHH